MDPEDIARWRETLVTNSAKWRLELLGLMFERKAKERMMVVAQTPHLKAGRFSKKIRDQNGNLIDVNANVINEAQVRIAQLEVQIEEKEILIAQAEEEIAELPVTVKDGET